MKDSTLNSSFASLLLRILYAIFLFTGISIEVNAQTDRVMPTSGTTTVNVVTGDRFVDSGGATSNYGRNESGVIIFSSAPGTVIRVVFTNFAVEQSWNCNKDALSAHDGNSTGSTQIGTYCGYNLPSIITSSGNSTTFSFVSDNKWSTNSGWVAEILVIDESEAFCIPSVSNYQWGNNEYISNVLIGDINNNSGSDGYSDYTNSQSTDVKIGTDNLLTVTNGRYDNDTYGVWVDWNQDGDFEDAGETIASESGDDVFTVIVTPPFGAVVGTTTMRIRVNYLDTATPCENTTWGELEDYTLNVIASGASPIAICKSYTVQLDASGNANITPANINNGSNDVETASADLLLSLDKSTFDCSNIGVNAVTLTVEDEDGNQSNCTTNVTIEDNLAPSLLNLIAEYYNGVAFDELKYSESVTEINTNWGNGSPNTALLGNDNFSIRYSGSFVVPETGDYTFYTNSDDGVRLFVDGSMIINNWTNHAPVINPATLSLSKGSHTITLDYFENGGGAVIELEWESADAGIARQVFSKSSIADHTTVEITLILNESGAATLNAIDVDPGFIDACGVTSRSLSKSSFSSADIGVNTVVLTVEDAGGNSTSFNVKVTVQAFIPEVSLSVDVNSINENGGKAFLTATLNGVASTDVLVDLAMSGVASASDYSISKPQIKILKGNLTGSVTLSAVDDSDVEGNESLNVSISNVTGGTENGTQMVMISIVDDDLPSTDPIQVDRQSPENGYSPNELVQNVLVNGCLVADNVTYGGDVNRGIGYFNAGTSDFPLSSGIILSTGNVQSAEGPNNSTGVSSNIGGAAVDADVTRLTGSPNDVQILEFDFIPAGDKLEFRYIFASEEYPEYACGSYNDVFGFIISGPGISGPFLNGGKNIALLPGSSNFVSINNVNNSGCGSSTYYVDGTGGFATQFDGRTTVLTANADVLPCQTYHIRLIIADVADDKYNSAVFLEAESFKSNEVVIQNGIGIENDVDIMYEGCSNSYIKFVRLENLDGEMKFDLNISGTAENGVDYIYVDQLGNQIGDGKLPSSVTIPAGIAEVVYYYKALSDTGIEGDEELRLSFLKSCPCSAPDYYEKVVTIIDVPEIEASPTSLVSCMGATPVATITVDLKNGLDPSDYQYSIDGGAFQDDNVFTLNNPTVGTVYTVTVQDRFACRSEDFDVTIPSVTPIAAEAGPSKQICEGATVQLNGSGGIYYEWSCSPASGLTYLSNVNSSNPTVANTIPFGTYTYTLTVKESSSASASCIDTDFMVLTVNENSHFTIASDKTEYCSGEVINLASTILNSSGGDIYSWTPVAGIASPTSANTTAIYNTAVLSAKDFSLTVTKSNGCKNTEYISGVLVNPHPLVSLNPSSNLCSDGSNGLLNVDVSGGTPFGSTPLYNYSWSHDGSLNSSNATGLNSGSYSVTVTDSKSCAEVGSYIIGTEPAPKGIYHE
ncbi:choice-of-anchor L domain-containing protein [Labilibaculum manganireducens]|uniref:choice-of-anchor L domain-containing protein n=1 Tax=Labilibaculum manganireducens TaxID=1940525 RepID=UPI0029F47B1E|nr:choice-of-anchor L domain-containing protein [Labilibaculum manganireducens]